MTSSPLTLLRTRLLRQGLDPDEVEDLLSDAAERDLDDRRDREAESYFDQLHSERNPDRE